MNLSLLRSDADRTGDVDHADALSVLGCGRQPTVSPLQNCVAQVVRKYLDDLENHACGGLFDAVLAEVEKPMLSEVLRHCDGKQIRAAELLGINRATLRKKLREYGLS